jgi:hypothetical protein
MTIVLGRETLIIIRKILCKIKLAVEVRSEIRQMDLTM